MFKKNIKYKDFNGTERDETFYFNLSKSELLDLELRTPGGIENYTKQIISTQDGQKLADLFKWLINESYGVKSPDGRSFIKGKEVLDNFRFTNAYDILYMQLATDDKAAAEFYNGIFPKDIMEQVNKERVMAENAGINLVKPEVPVQPAVPLVEGQVVAPAAPMVEGQVPVNTVPFTQPTL